MGEIKVVDLKVPKGKRILEFLAELGERTKNAKIVFHSKCAAKLFSEHNSFERLDSGPPDTAVNMLIRDSKDDSNGEKVIIGRLPDDDGELWYEAIYISYSNIAFTFKSDNISECLRFISF